MTDDRFCTVTDEDRVRVVTINRPEVMNALHSEAHWEFDLVWNEFAADPDLWVGIIAGAACRADRRQRRASPAADDRAESGARHDPDRAAGFRRGRQGTRLRQRG